MSASLEELESALRRAGAHFAYVFGSHARGSAGPDSDLDLAAYFGNREVDPLDVDGVDFDRVDLIVLDAAPLELKGRVALQGRLLFELDPAERVEWEATTRKIYFDERPRLERAWQDFREATRRRVGRS
jgi:predicted nucleotidyltransferase